MMFALMPEPPEMNMNVGEMSVEQLKRVIGYARNAQGVVKSATLVDDEMRARAVHARGVETVPSINQEQLAAVLAKGEAAVNELIRRVETPAEEESGVDAPDFTLPNDPMMDFPDEPASEDDDVLDQANDADPAYTRVADLIDLWPPLSVVVTSLPDDKILTSRAMCARGDVEALLRWIPHFGWGSCQVEVRDRTQVFIQGFNAGDVVALARTMTDQQLREAVISAMSNADGDVLPGPSAAFDVLWERLMRATRALG